MSQSSVSYCEDCGCKVFNGHCVNCHEELYIQDQYIEQGIPLPANDTEFMRRVREQEMQIAQKSK